MRLSELIADLQRMQEPGLDPEVIIDLEIPMTIKDVFAGKDYVYIETEEM